MLAGQVRIYAGSAAAPLDEEVPTGTMLPSSCNGPQLEPCQIIELRIDASSLQCTPGESLPCSYNGPSGTQGVGVCQAGANMCNVWGTGWSGCTGEVVPKNETCATIFDDDCDGQANEAGGAGCTCGAGDTTACYSGPPDSMGVGVCQGGTRTCDTTIGKYGSCIGEIVPTPETCDTPADDDCDGSTECAGLTLWSRRFGDGSSQSPMDLALDASDNIFITGVYSGSPDFGGGALPATGGQAVFVAKLRADGRHEWSRGFLSSGTPYPMSIGTDAQGNVLVTGQFRGTMSLGASVLTSAGDADMFMAKLGASGQLIWSDSFGDTKFQSGTGIAADRAGNVILAGNMWGQTDFGGGLIGSGNANADVSLAKFSPNGQHLWSKGYGGWWGGQTATDVTVDPQDYIVVVGATNGPIDFGNGPQFAGGVDTFVAKFTPDGDHVWSKVFGDGALQWSTDVTTDSAGNVFITGYFDGSIDLGGGSLPSAGSHDIFVAKFTPGGQHLWSRRFGAADTQGGARIAVDSAGNVLLTGWMTGNVDFGGGAMDDGGGYDAYVIKLSAHGQHLWSRGIGSVCDDEGLGVAADRQGNPLWTGYFCDTVDFGDAVRTSAGAADVFVAKLNP
jgi:hypothetical protein